jgi:multidrug efflux pump subunit AcrA (membrane-fusion protein)
MEKLLVRTELNQIDVARLKPNGKVDISVDALPGQKFTGEIYRIAAMALKSDRRKDSNLLVFPVDIVIARSQKGAEALRPGMMADISIDIDQHDGVLVVPIEAVTREGAKSQVWKVMGEKQPDQSVDVVTGLQNDRSIEIVSGVKEGDAVRVRPADASAQTVKM